MKQLNIEICQVSERSFCITQTWKSIVENEGRVEEEYSREDPWVKCCSFRSSNFTIHVGRQNAERSQLQTCCKCWWCHNWRPNELTWPIWVELWALELQSYLASDCDRGGTDVYRGNSPFIGKTPSPKLLYHKCPSTSALKHWAPVAVAQCLF